MGQAGHAPLQVGPPSLLPRQTRYSENLTPIGFVTSSQMGFSRPIQAFDANLCVNLTKKYIFFLLYNIIDFNFTFGNNWWSPTQRGKCLAMVIAM